MPRKTNARLQPPQEATLRQAKWPGWGDPVCLVSVLLAIFLAYLPALNGGMLLDDDSHITRPELQSIRGLYRIWFELGATYQYYPLLHSVFWLEHKLWNDSVLGYHLVTLFWHMTSVVLLYLILTRLKIPGALLAAAIFGLHPVMVESVAWMSEQKNTLSAVFCLSAMLAYLKFDESRHRSYYFAALLLFVLGLLTKTVITATLPFTLLVVFWWQRGNITSGRDLRPLLPFFVLGAIGGCVTAWVERKLIGAEGVDFELTLLERGLVASRVIWFYLGKLVWPANLVFFYPRWDINPKVWWQWLFPIATLATFAVLWIVRRRWRGPLAAWLVFVGTLVPVLGFLNVYPFIFSFVADHFQYLASVAAIVFISAGVANALGNVSLSVRRVGVGLCIAWIGTLAVLTSQQSRMYNDVVTFYRAILERNPVSWAAHNNLGTILSSQGRQQEAIEHYRAAIRARRDYFTAHANLGTALAAVGELPAAFDHLHKAVELQPESVIAHRKLGSMLAKSGNLTEGIAELQRATTLNPRDVEAINDLSIALSQAGRFSEAIHQLRKAVQICANAEAHNNLGTAIMNTGELPAAIEEFQAALSLKPDFVEALSNLGNALIREKRLPEAVQYLERAVQLKPDSADVHSILGASLLLSGKTTQAIEHYRTAIRLKPEVVEQYANLAHALKLANQSNEAISTAQKGIQLARSTGQAGIAEKLQGWLTQFQIEMNGKPNAQSSPKLPASDSTP